ncbi:MAG: hypothetical protein H0T51_07385, partial [Pirellulales bacterium]|nr:hypothetical protein [Pirellulales bacterium]
MNRMLTTFLAVLALPAVAWAQGGPAINGLDPTPRVFNDFSTSTAVVTGVGINPGIGSISDAAMVDDGMGGNFANRHDILLSADGGATPALFTIDDSFTFQTTLNLTVGSTTPRKEAGIRINSPIT